MRHLQASSLEAALDIKPLIRLAAIQDGLVAAHILGDEIQRLDDLQPELLALLIFGYGDVFDVAYFAKVVDARTFTESH